MSPPTTIPSGNRGPQLIVLLWVFTAIATITVVMRLLSTAIRQKSTWADAIMLFSLICFYGWAICLTVLCLNGGEKHIQAVIAMGPAVVSRVQLLNWVSQVFGILGVGAGKVSISVLLLAILRNTRRTWQEVYLWVVGIGLTVGVSVSCSILSVTQCRPAAALWDPIVKGTCIDPKVMADYGTFTGAFFTFVDASLSFIPSTIFFRLQINQTEKIQLSIVFALNILTSMCSAIKTSFLSHLANRQDFTWATYDIFVWVTAEFFLLIFSGTLPTLKPIVDIVRRLSVRAQSDGQSSRLSLSRSGQGHRSTYLRPSKKNASGGKFSQSEDQIELTPDSSSSNCWTS